MDLYQQNDNLKSQNLGNYHWTSNSESSSSSSEAIYHQIDPADSLSIGSLVQQHQQQPSLTIAINNSDDNKYDEDVHLTN